MNRRFTPGQEVTPNHSKGELSGMFGKIYTVKSYHHHYQFPREAFIQLHEFPPVMKGGQMIQQLWSESNFDAVGSTQLLVSNLRGIIT